MQRFGSQDPRSDRKGCSQTFSLCAKPTDPFREVGRVTWSHVSALPATIMVPAVMTRHRLGWAFCPGHLTLPPFAVQGLGLASVQIQRTSQPQYKPQTRISLLWCPSCKITYKMMPDLCGCRRLYPYPPVRCALLAPRIQIYPMESSIKPCAYPVLPMPPTPMSVPAKIVRRKV